MIHHCQGINFISSVKTELSDSARDGGGLNYTIEAEIEREDIRNIKERDQPDLE